jgi:hypothetical protein
MVAKVVTRATYAELEALAPNLVGELVAGVLYAQIFELDREAWRVVKTFHGDVTVSAQPFDAIDLELSTLWEGVEA